jgi:heat shock protein HtpX
LHDVLQRGGQRRIVATACAGVALLTFSLTLLVFPLVWVSVFVFSPWFGSTNGWGDVGLSLAISVAIGAVAAMVSTAVAWQHSERDALRSAALQLTVVPGARLDVVPSWRVAGDALPRVRTMLDALSIAAGVLPPRCAVVVDPAPNLLCIGRRSDTAWIVCTTGLLDEFPRRELEALLAYELGRVACREVSLDTVVYACTANTYEAWAGVFGFDHGGALLAPLAVLGLPLLAGCALLRRSALSARARLSDGLAIQFCRDPLALLAALRRLAADPRTVRFAGTPNAHLWLDYPHTRASRWLLGTRRLLNARIRRLEKMLPAGLGHPPSQTGG